MNETRNVLVVDDDRSIVELMRDFLEYDGFHVVEAGNASEALTIINRDKLDCVLLDIMMPGQSGFELCKQIRTMSDVPILFLSARGDDVDKIRGLGMGADDYIVKSATPAEVVARVKAVLRRYPGTIRANGAIGIGTGKQSLQGAILHYNRLVLDERAHEVRIDGKPISFTPREFDILCLLAEHPRQVFTYDQLLERFWGNIGDKHTVTVHIRRIREKIETNPEKPELIVNVWGIGYRFEGGKT